MRDPARSENFSIAELCRAAGPAAWVQRALGDPDVLAPNPHVAGGADMRLYSRARVERAEAGAEFKASWALRNWKPPT
jgi:hypothetical protein